MDPNVLWVAGDKFDYCGKVINFGDCEMGLPLRGPVSSGAQWIHMACLSEHFQNDSPLFQWTKILKREKRAVQLGQVPRPEDIIGMAVIHCWAETMMRQSSKTFAYLGVDRIDRSKEASAVLKLLLQVSKFDVRRVSQLQLREFLRRLIEATRTVDASGRATQRNARCSDAQVLGERTASTAR
jgi:hypothetical protein